MIRLRTLSIKKSLALKPYRSLRYLHDILFFGSDEFSVLALDAIRSNPKCYKTLEVVTPPDNRKAKKEASVLLKRYCKQHGIISHDASPKSLKDWSIPVSSQGKQFELGVVVSFGYFIPDNVLNALPKGAINVHPSLLPKYRGASPLQYTILNDDRECGVSIQEVSPWAFDAGKILKQTRVETPIRPNYDSLLQYLGKIAQDDLTDVLLHLSEYRVKSVAQDESRVVPARKFAKQAGEINWENQSSVEIERLYRAIGSKIPLQTTINGKTCFLLSIEVAGDNTSLSSMDPSSPPGTIFLSTDKTHLQIKTIDGALFCSSVHVQGKKPLNAKDFWNGYAIGGKIPPFRTKLSSPPP